MHDAEQPGMQAHHAAVAIRLLITSGRSTLRVAAVAKERMTIGRRPQNDIALDDLTVSGEHAAIETHGTESVIHDLDSRNGTHVNGRPIAECPLVEGDCIDIGIYRLRLVPAGEANGQPAAQAAGADIAVAPANPVLEYLTGPYAGITQRVDRNIVRIGDGELQAAVIARRRPGWFVTHLEGMAVPMVNGVAIGLVASPLADGDVIELAGAQIRFRLQG